MTIPALMNVDVLGYPRASLQGPLTVTLDERYVLLAVGEFDSASMRINVADCAELIKRLADTVRLYYSKGETA
jgi:hypothetical protein